MKTGQQKRVCLAALFFLASAGGSAEGGFTGNDLKPECDRGTELCLSWVSGMHMMHGLMVGLNRKPLYCRPDGVINSQVIEIFRAYLRKNPATLHLPADAIFVLTLQEAFPCRR